MASPSPTGDDEYSDIGFDFKKFSRDKLQHLARQLNLCIPSYRGSKPLKADYLYFVEKHYSDRRVHAGLQPTEYLEPGFPIDTRYRSYIRQILTQHDYRYLDDGKAIGDASKPELLACFADKIDEMRNNAGYCIAELPADGIELVIGGLGSMTTAGDEEGRSSQSRFTAQSPHPEPAAVSPPSPPSSNIGKRPVPRPAVRPDHTLSSDGWRNEAPRAHLSCTAAISAQSSALRTCGDGRTWRLQEKVRLNGLIEDAAVLAMERVHESRPADVLGVLDRLRRELSDEFQLVNVSTDRSLI